MRSIPYLTLTLALLVAPACGRERETKGDNTAPSAGTPTPMAGAAGGDTVGSAATAPGADPGTPSAATVDPGTPGSVQGAPSAGALPLGGVDGGIDGGAGARAPGASGGSAGVAADAGTAL